ncbi:hypothetical protein K402DRAFT_338074, partial [Aulographum hederae CBS 113979]
MSAIEIPLPPWPTEGVHPRRWMPAYAITVQVITTLLLGVRIISRTLRLKTKTGLDDLFIVIAWPYCLQQLSLMTTLGTEKYGFDRDMWDVPYYVYSKGAFWSWMIEMMFLLTTGFTKLSVLLLYRRLVAGTCGKKFKWSLWAAMGFVVACTVAFIPTLIFNCNPVQAHWLRFDIMYRGDYKCAPRELERDLTVVSAAFSVVTDFYSVILPARLLSKLQVPRRQKVGLYVIFGLGLLVVGAGCARTYYLYRAFDPMSSNLTYWGFNAYIVAIAEANLGIICACAPSLRTVFSRFFKQTFSH